MVRTGPLRTCNHLPCLRTSKPSTATSTRGVVRTSKTHRVVRRTERRDKEQGSCVCKERRTGRRQTPSPSLRPSLYVDTQK